VKLNEPVMISFASIIIYVQYEATVSAGHTYVSGYFIGIGIISP
jgi:hypothetical protein